MLLLSQTVKMIQRGNGTVQLRGNVAVLRVLEDANCQLLGCLL